MTVIILMMAGIIIGGPYVIRSWNAQMKSWDDSVIDSFRDPLAEGPPVPITGCDPQGWVDGGCNVSTPNPCNPSETITCGVLDRLWKQSYTPAGCACDPYYQYTPDDIVRCTPDTSCCTPWADVACGVNANPPCPDGQMQQTRTCDVGGVATPEIQCVDDAACVFSCIGPPPPSWGTVCLGSDVGLPRDLNWSIVSACIPGEKCKILCPNVVGGQCVNACPNGDPDYNRNQCVGQLMLNPQCWYADNTTGQFGSPASCSSFGGGTVYACPNGDPNYGRNQCLGQLSANPQCWYVDGGNAGGLTVPCPPFGGGTIYACSSGDQDYTRNQCVNQLSANPTCLLVDAGGERTASCTPL